MKEIKGNIIGLAKEGKFNVIVQGCNCFCRMGRGLAPQIKEHFPEAWYADNATIAGDITKLGNYTYATCKNNVGSTVDVINIYSQYSYDSSTKPLDYEALTLALRKINRVFEGVTIGVPLIGAGLAGGDWDRIKVIIETELKNMDVTIVHYDN